MSLADSFADIVWDEEGMPQSIAFGDKYFCRSSGYDESVYVCCQANALRERFLALNSAEAGTFTILETGFGTGLDFCCVWQLWRETAPRSWRLHFISVELYPLAVEHLSRALAFWPVLAPQAAALAAQYAPLPGQTKSFLFDEDRVTLTVVFRHVQEALGLVKTAGLAPEGVDVVLLDGFAPSKNPEMWSDHVFEGVAALSRKGTTLTTFTVAGFVRRGLTDRGFVIRKIPGLGGKKHVLSAFFDPNSFLKSGT